MPKEIWFVWGVGCVSLDGPPNGSKKRFVRDSVEPEGRDPGDEPFKGRQSPVNASRYDIIP